MIPPKWRLLLGLATSPAWLVARFFWCCVTTVRVAWYALREEVTDEVIAFCVAVRTVRNDWSRTTWLEPTQPEEDEDDDRNEEAEDREQT